MAIEGELNAPGEQLKAYDPPPEPAKPQGPQGHVEFKVGAKVTFDDGKGVALVGMIIRVNRRTAKLRTMDGKPWRVGFRTSNSSGMSSRCSRGRST